MNSFHHEIIHELWMDDCVDYIYAAGEERPTGMSTDLLLTKLQHKCNEWTQTALSYILA